VSLASLLGRLPPDLRIVLADIGSAGGLPGRWQAVRPIVSGLLFEPRDVAETRRDGADLIFPIGLGPAPGTATLNITALANMSSTLKPNAALLQTYARKFAHTRITGTIGMRVDTLDALVAGEGVAVDAIKVDTQGSELGILAGAVGCLGSSVLMAEVEVSFFQRYEGQATLCDIAAFMADHGFELIDLYRLKRYRRANSAGIGNMSLGKGQRAGRLAYGDAFFMLREDKLRARIDAAEPAAAEAMALKAVLLMLVYGKPDMAAQLFDQLGSVVREPWRGSIAQWLGKLGRRPTGTGVLHHVFDYLARHV
jgi:FkbM family methyltransferase